ncbi:MAG: ABC transporter substrate-binding protein [Candidatus Limnocylindria bacterium]
MSRISRPTPVFFVATAVLLSACTGAGNTTASAGEPTGVVAPSDAPSASAAAEECSPDSLATKTAGRLTIGTDNPAFPPYWEPAPDGEDPTDPWEFGDPTNKGGLEGAIAWAVAEELGYGDDTVDFIAVPFDNSYAPGEKDFDFYLAQVSFTEERSQVVDMSDGYYFSNQALVSNADTPITEAGSIADVAEFHLGVQAGTTSLAYIEEQIQPSIEPSVYSSNDAAIAALNAGQIDGIVVDLPTAFFVTAVQMDNGVVVGQFPPEGDEQEHFSLVLEQGSPLTDCVNAAIGTLDLDEFAQEWLSDNADVPVLE